MMRAAYLKTCGKKETLCSSLLPQTAQKNQKIPKTYQDLTLTRMHNFIQNKKKIPVLVNEYRDLIIILFCYSAVLPLASRSLSFSSTSIRFSSTSAAFLRSCPSAWIFITSSIVEISCSLVCFSVSISTIERSFS